MAKLRLDEIARIAGGAILRGSPGLTFESFGIDSRLAAADELFFAVIGKRDGHDFVGAAADRGAAGAVVSRRVPLSAKDFGLVQVEDTVAALQALARDVLGRRPVKVVGITGSVGKTTTKEFTAALLAGRLRVLKSEGNFNNHLGLALSLLRLGQDDEAAVLEMGMSAAGELRTLTRIAPPDIAVITNVSPVHLQFFKGLDDIALAKKEILDGAKPGATAVLNGDDPLVMKIASGFPGRRVTFGRTRGCDVRAEDVIVPGLFGFRVPPALWTGIRPYRFLLRQRRRRFEPPRGFGRLPRLRPSARGDPAGHSRPSALLRTRYVGRSGRRHPGLR